MIFGISLRFLWKQPQNEKREEGETPVIGREEPRKCSFI